MSTSEPEAEEQRPLLRHSLDQRRPSYWSFGCLCTVIFLLVVCLNWTPRIANEANGRFHVDFNKWLASSWLAGPGIIVYIYLLPILAGMYTDILVGRYRTLLFALGLNTAGSLLALIAIIVCEAQRSIGPVPLRVSFAMWFIGITWIMTGMVVAILTVFTFSMQQVEQTIPALSRICRWLMVAVMAGYLGGSLTKYFDVVTLFGVFGERYSGTVSHAVFLAVDCCSVAVFLCGKTDYRHTDSRTDDGKKSWKELVRIFRTYVVCPKYRNEFDINLDDSSLSAERARAEGLARRKLDRLKLKKGVLMIALLSCTAVTLSMSYTENLIFYFRLQHWTPWWGKHIVEGSYCITTIIGVTVFEIIRKYGGHHLWQNNCVNILKTIGVGSSLAALSVALAGAVATLIYQHEVMSSFWLLPADTLMGLMVMFVFPPLMVLCYHESPPGMATVVTALAACLSVFYLGFLFVFSIASPEPKRSDRYDTVFYSLAGAMVVVVALYIPISVMYIKVNRAIQEAESLDDTTSPETLASIGH